VASPTAERGDGVLVLDRAPEASGALELPALGGQAREKADAEHAAAPDLHLIGERLRLAGARVTLVDAAGIQGELGKLSQHSALPPGNGDLARQRHVLRDELVRTILVVGVAGERAERSDRLRLSHAWPRLGARPSTR